jgi:hypothetical protein
MAWTLTNTEGNQITLTNTDSGAAMLYTIHALNTSGIFEEIDGYPALPTTSLAASTAISIDLTDDNVYKLIVDDSPDEEYYFVMDNNIKECKKKILKAFLCDSCSCNAGERNAKISNRMKFFGLEQSFYWIVNKWAQSQSVTNLLTTSNADILYVADLMTQLSNLCSDCITEGCSDCGNSTNVNDCGC